MPEEAPQTIAVLPASPRSIAISLEALLEASRDSYPPFRAFAPRGTDPSGVDPCTET
jgi:hypothetical protein